MRLKPNTGRVVSIFLALNLFFSLSISFAQDNSTLPIDRLPKLIDLSEGNDEISFFI